MRAFASSGIAIGAALLLALSAAPASAGLPGSTQPGAQPVPPGNLVIVRVVPPRNAIIPGAGAAITAPTAPPSVVFATAEGVGQPLSDSQAASVIGSIAPGQSGSNVAAAIDGVFGSRAMAAVVPEHAAGVGIAASIGGTVQPSVGTITGILGNLQGPGH